MTTAKTDEPIEVPFGYRLRKTHTIMYIRWNLSTPPRVPLLYLCVCLLDVTVSSANTGEPIEMPDEVARRRRRVRLSSPDARPSTWSRRATRPPPSRSRRRRAATSTCSTTEASAERRTDRRCCCSCCRRRRRIPRHAPPAYSRQCSSRVARHDPAPPRSTIPRHTRQHLTDRTD